MSRVGELHRALAFVRSKRRIAVERDVVRGVMVNVLATRVPGAPVALIGLTGWRGSIIPLIEPTLNAQLTHSEAPHTAVVVATPSTIRSFTRCSSRNCADVPQ